MRVSGFRMPPSGLCKNLAKVKLVLHFAQYESAGPFQTFSDGLLEHGLIADTGSFGDLLRLFEVGG